MTLRLELPEMPAADLITLLADPHQASRAYTRLLALGAEATEAARSGLSNPDERVREHCCKILDHLMDADSIPLLIGALGDPCERVRIAAVHALACDRCKTDTCRPSPEGVLPTAIDVHAHNPSLLSTRTRPNSSATGRTAAWPPATRSQPAAQDPSPAVRKTASWHAPGGAIDRRTQPRPACAVPETHREESVTTNNQKCSFCGRTESMARLVFGPDAAICEYCARVASDCLAHGDDAGGGSAAGDGQDRRQLATESIAERAASAGQAEPGDVPSAERDRLVQAERIIRFRTGIGADRPHTLAETAREFGLSRDHVRQLEAEILFGR